MPGVRSKVVSVTQILFLALICVSPAESFAEAQSAPLALSKRPIYVRGTVMRVIRHECAPMLRTAQRAQSKAKACTEIDLAVSSRSGIRYVVVGPERFLRKNQFFFEAGDHLVVVGLGGKAGEAILSEEVVRNKRALTLRDGTGFPFWNQRSVRFSANKASASAMQIDKEKSHAK